MRFLFTFFFILIGIFSYGQEREISGRVIDRIDSFPIPNARVYLLNNQSYKTTTDSNGNYILKVKGVEKDVLIISITGYHTRKVKISLKGKKRHTYDFGMETKSKKLREVKISGKQKRDIKKTEQTKTRIEINESQTNPSGNVEQILKFQGLGVGGNNEMGSQYAVRGGSFDENLIYVNDFEIYRPLLIRNAQQEGLSFANSRLIRSIDFSSGGFAPKYGDKMSSVLDIKYKRPKKWAGSIDAGLLGVNAHIEGSALDKKLSLLSSIRYRNNSYLLGAQEVEGSYTPFFWDFQNDIIFKPTKKLEFESLTSISQNQFTLFPSERQTDFGLANQALTYRVEYEGGENDKYFNIMQGIGVSYFISDNTRLSYRGAYYTIDEKQYFDIRGQYAIGEIDSDVSSSNYQNFKNIFGSGIFHNFGREKYQSEMIHNQISLNALLGTHNVKVGVKHKMESFDIFINTWNRLDSAGYNIPYYGNAIQLQDVTKINTQFSGNRYEFYVQDEKKWNLSNDRLAGIILGVRGNYWDVNEEFFISPRVHGFYNLKKNWSIYASVGSYNQAPFMREMISSKGFINYQIQSQKSLHYILGSHYYLKLFDNPFKFTAEAYYKHMWDINRFQYDNVLVRYEAKNNTVAFTRGIDLRLQGEFVKGVESWINVGFMQSQEYDPNTYTRYRDSLGREYLFVPSNLDVPLVDTTTFTRGYIPRPLNQTFMVNMYLQDYVPMMPRLKFNANIVIAAGLPFGPPNIEAYRNSFELLSYKRLDVGFSYLIFERSEKKSDFFSKTFRKVWASLDIFNIVDFQNQVSMNWVRDYSNNQFAVPNYLTGRRFNGKVVFEF